MSLRSFGSVVVCLFVGTQAYAGLILPGDITAEATGPGGAVVTYSASVAGAGDAGDGRQTETVACTPPSLSLFPLGTTTVSCLGSEGSTGSFTVTVVDQTAPALSLPADIDIVTTNLSEIVTYNASATDLVDGSTPITCSPASGSSFAIGTTTVACSATDTHGNSASGSFTVTLAATAPPPQPNPLDITAEAMGPDGTTVFFTAGTGSNDNGRTGVDCAPASGSVFPLGTTAVVCPSASFHVMVVDTTPPSLALPTGVSAASSTPTAVSFTATAVDLVDGSVAVTCSPASGSIFPLGTTTVSCSATDAHGNSASGSFPLVVATAPPPPPNPDNIVAEAAGPAGAAVSFDAGTEPGGRAATCSPASGSTFPLGTTSVACSNGVTFTVTIVDTTPPALTVPPSQAFEATSSSGAIATFTATATDIVSGVVPVTCAPSSGSTFPLGTTTVACTATDAAGNVASGNFTISVVDTTPPQIAGVTASPNTIWPPNQRLIDVAVTVQVADAVDPTPLVRIYGITCNEAIQPDDAIVTGPLTAQLRADRNGSGNGRIYTLFIEAIDHSGNRSTAAVTVTVPHDQRRRSAGR